MQTVTTDCFNHVPFKDNEKGFELIKFVLDNDEDGWVDVSDLSEMRIWEFEKLNKLLLENFGFRTDVSGNLTKEVA